MRRRPVHRSVILYKAKRLASGCGSDTADFIRHVACTRMALGNPGAVSWRPSHRTSPGCSECTRHTCAIMKCVVRSGVYSSQRKRLTSLEFVNTWYTSAREPGCDGSTSSARLTAWTNPSRVQHTWAICRERHLQCTTDQLILPTATLQNQGFSIRPGD